MPIAMPDTQQQDKEAARVKEMKKSAADLFQRYSTGGRYNEDSGRTAIEAIDTYAELCMVELARQKARLNLGQASSTARDYEDAKLIELMKTVSSEIHLSYGTYPRDAKVAGIALAAMRAYAKLCRLQTARSEPRRALLPGLRSNTPSLTAPSPAQG